MKDIKRQTHREGDRQTDRQADSLIDTERMPPKIVQVTIKVGRTGLLAKSLKKAIYWSTTRKPWKLGRPGKARETIPLWSRMTKNVDVSSGPIACPFARSFTLLTHSLARHC